MTEMNPIFVFYTYNHVPHFESLHSKYDNHILTSHLCPFAQNEFYIAEFHIFESEFNQHKMFVYKDPRYTKTYISSTTN